MFYAIFFFEVCPRAGKQDKKMQRKPRAPLHSPTPPGLPRPQQQLRDRRAGGWGLLGADSCRPGPPKPSPCLAQTCAASHSLLPEPLSVDDTLEAPTLSSPCPSPCPSPDSGERTDPHPPPQVSRLVFLKEVVASNGGWTEEARTGGGQRPSHGRRG